MTGLSTDCADSVGAPDTDIGPAPVLLGADDPAPVTCVNPDGGTMLLICDHASARIPRQLDNLGLGADALARHIAWDIGAAKVSHILADRFQAPLILCGYSRLVVDCNRHLDDPTAIAVESDHVPIPGNRNLSAADSAARAQAIYHPYHRAIDGQIARLKTALAAPPVISVHSFTPVFEGYERPWHIGVLWNQDDRLAKPFMQALRARGDVLVGDNQPYSARENYGYSVAVHAEDHGLPHLLLEIRQDLIDTDAGVASWSAIVGNALFDALKALPAPQEDII